MNNSDIAENAMLIVENVCVTFSAMYAGVLVARTYDEYQRSKENNQPFLPRLDLFADKVSLKRMSKPYSLLRQAFGSKVPVGGK